MMPLFENCFKYRKMTYSYIVSASVFMLSMPIGSLLSGVLMDVYGRKKLFQLSYIPLFLGWAVISQADTAFTICLGRLITGFAIGNQLLHNINFDLETYDVHTIQLIEGNMTIARIFYKGRSLRAHYGC